MDKEEEDIKESKVDKEFKGDKCGKDEQDDMDETSWPYFGVKLSCVCLMFP